MSPAGGLVTLGETLALAASVDAGSLAHAATLRLGIGGAESNVAIGVRRLGGSATWIGRVGADSLGARVGRELRAEDVAVRAIEDAGAATALMVKERPRPDRGRVWYYRSGSAGSRLCPTDLPEDLVAAAGLVHLTGITPGLSASALAAVRHAQEIAADHGVPVSFDVNHRTGVWGSADPRPAYTEIAAAAAIVFAGEDEARLLTGSTSTDEEELLDELDRVSGGDAVLKLGAAGCLARIAGADHRVPAVPVPVVDTVGAGDAFVAGYLTELLAGRPVADRLTTAVRCGALACTIAGDWEGFPTRADLADFDDEGDPVQR